jgi:hypothetical protein
MCGEVSLCGELSSSSIVVSSTGIMSSTGIIINANAKVLKVLYTVVAASRQPLRLTVHDEITDISIF